MKFYWWFCSCDFVFVNIKKIVLIIVVVIYICSVLICDERLYKICLDLFLKLGNKYYVLSIEIKFRI